MSHPNPSNTLLATHSRTGPAPTADPMTVDWANIALPDAWPDRLNFANLEAWLRVLRPVLKTPARVEIPADLPGRDRLPKYLIQEFHGIPNGNFSKRITRGYITAFDRIMLGSLKPARRKSVEFLKDCDSVLDIGCGGGQTCGQLAASGVAEVWGLDSSPYLLQHAARSHPRVRFIHGLAEHLEFAAERFAGATVCFVLHELPPKVTLQALREVHRVLKPGGKLAICEPSAGQMYDSLWELSMRHGLSGLYFGLLARLIHEPFIAAWHKLDIVNSLYEVGFDVLTESVGMPVRHIFAVKTR